MTIKSLITCSIFFIVVNCKTDESKVQSLKIIDKDTTATNLNIDSVIINYMKPITKDSLRGLIEAETSMDANIKTMLDSLLRTIEKDSLK